MGDEDVDCRAVVEELYTFLDGELTESRRLQISSHMHGCADCHEVVEFHAELKMVIASRCRDEVPAQLRARVEQALGLGGPPGEYRGFQGR